MLDLVVHTLNVKALSPLQGGNVIVRDSDNPSMQIAEKSVWQLLILQADK